MWEGVVFSDTVTAVLSIHHAFTWLIFSDFHFPFRVGTFAHNYFLIWIMGNTYYYTVYFILHFQIYSHVVEASLCWMCQFLFIFFFHTAVGDERRCVWVWRSVVWELWSCKWWIFIFYFVAAALSFNFKNAVAFLTELYLCSARFLALQTASCSSFLHFFFFSVLVLVRNLS